MVRDNDDLVDYAYLNITVVTNTDIHDIQGIVHHQVRYEDSPHWALNLSAYEPISNSEHVEFYWYLLGENSSLYTVSGENGTNDRLIFKPQPDAFGNDLVTLVLHNTENLSASQPLCR